MFTSVTFFISGYIVIGRWVGYFHTFPHAMVHCIIVLDPIDLKLSLETWKLTIHLNRRRYFLHIIPIIRQPQMV